MYFLILFANIFWEVLGVEIRLGVHNFITVLLRTNHLLKHPHLINNIVLKTGVTVGVLTFSYFGEFLDVVFTFTYTT